MIPIEELKLYCCAQVSSRRHFWWYLLRNWNLTSLNTKYHPARSFDDTYWGIETYKHQIHSAAGFLLMIPIEELKLTILPSPSSCRSLLLMIPIEELKLAPHIRICAVRLPFDDTYWGIETRSAVFPCCLLPPFDDTYWGIETKSCQTAFLSIILLMIPIEELKRAKPAPTSSTAAFWWYLLRNWNKFYPWRWIHYLNFWWYLLRNWNVLSRTV